MTDSGTNKDSVGAVSPGGFSIARLPVFFMAMRPVHWVKNLLVIAPIFFSGNLLDPVLILVELAAFAAFSLIASHIYLINDVIDRDADANCDLRRNRPYAAGLLSRNDMLMASVAVGIAGAAISVFLGPFFQAALLGYAVIMYFYTFLLKRFVLVGVGIISAGMLIRILAGALAIDVPISPWVYPCAFLLSYYVVAGKRIFNEGGLDSASNAVRTVFMVTGFLTLCAYTVYCFSGIGPEKYDTPHLWITIPFVAAALVRFYGLMKRPPGGREHLQSTLSDFPLIATCFAWAGVFGFLIYL